MDKQPRCATLLDEKLPSEITRDRSSVIKL